MSASSARGASGKARRDCSERGEQGRGGRGRKKKKERDIFCVISHAWLTSLTPRCISQLCAAADVEAGEAWNTDFLMIVLMMRRSIALSAGSGEVLVSAAPALDIVPLCLFQYNVLLNQIKEKTKSFSLKRHTSGKAFLPVTVYVQKWRNMHSQYKIS